jgi:hypothetical protein
MSRYAVVAVAASAALALAVALSASSAIGAPGLFNLAGDWQETIHTAIGPFAGKPDDHHNLRFTGVPGDPNRYTGTYLDSNGCAVSWPRIMFTAEVVSSAPGAVLVTIHQSSPDNDYRATRDALAPVSRTSALLPPSSFAGEFIDIGSSGNIGGNFGTWTVHRFAPVC